MGVEYEFVLVTQYWSSVAVAWMCVVEATSHLCSRVAGIAG
jgi:hypothetical protein